MPHDPDTIFKAFRAVPDFDGNLNVLIRFIRICDQIVNTYISTEPGSSISNECIISNILNKITGPAATVVGSNGDSDSWLAIRETLIRNFADKK